MTTTLTLNEDQLIMLLSGLEAECIDTMTEQELTAYDKLKARIFKALHRLEA